MRPTVKFSLHRIHPFIFCYIFAPDFTDDFKDNFTDNFTDDLKDDFKNTDGFKTIHIMKKFFNATLAAAAGILALSSCCSQPELNGTWDITSVAGEQVVLNDSLSSAAPFIEFNAAEGRFHGNAGCNIMNGSYTFSGDSLSFSQAATTMMAGPQELMELESKVLNALNTAATVKTVSDDVLQVCDAEENAVMELTKRAEPAAPESAADAANDTDSSVVAVPDSTAAVQAESAGATK